MTEHFGDVLSEFIESRQRSSGQLSSLSGIPKHTIVSWREGRVKKPRSTIDVLKVAHALNLTEPDVNRLLMAAKKEAIELLRDRANTESDEPLLEMLRYWQAMDVDASSELSLAAVPMTAPRSTINFVNRIEQLEALEKSLLSGGLCALWGMGGIGKTEIAKLTAERVRTSFPDGILWAALTPQDADTASDEQQVNNILGSWLKLCGWQPGNDGEAFESITSRAHVLRTILSQRKMLVILDDVANAASVEWFLPPPGSECALLLTTRNSRVARAYGQLFEVSQLTIDESVELIKGFIGEQRLYMDEASVRHLAQLLDGHPLALAVVGSDLEETRSLTVREYHALLQDEHMRLAHFRDWDDGARRVQATFELSYRRMSVESQTLLMLLSHFGDNDFSAEATASMLQQPVIVTKRQLGRLCSLALLNEIQPTHHVVSHQNDTTAPIDSRYKLHRLVQVFAREKLEESAENYFEERIRLAKFYTDFAKQYAAQPYQLLPVEWPNILAMVDWLEDQGLWDLYEAILAPLTQFSLGLAGYLDGCGYWRLGIQLLEKLKLNLVWSDRPLDYAEILIKLAYFEQRIGRYSEALAHAKQAEQYMDPVEQSSPVQPMLQMLHVYIAELRSRIYEKNDRPMAQLEIEKAISIIQSIPGPERSFEAGYLSIRRGSIVGQMGQLDDALVYSLNGLSLLPDSPTSAHASGLTNIGIIHDMQGRADEAIAAWQDSMAIAESIGDLRRRGILWTNMGVSESQRGRLHSATEYMNRALDCYEPFGFVEGEARLYTNLGANYILLREFDIADAYLVDAESLSRQHNLKSILLLTLINRVRLEIEWHAKNTINGSSHLMVEADTALQDDMVSQTSQGRAVDFDACQKWRREIDVLRKDLQEQLYDPEITRLEIELELISGNLSDAGIKAESLLAQEHLSPHEKGLAIRLFGDILARRGEIDKAKANYQDALMIFQQTNEFELARTLLLLGLCQLGIATANEMRDDSAETLRKAKRIFQTLGCDAYLEFIPTS